MSASTAPAIAQLEKCPTGIKGLDEIMAGGFPRGRPTLVCGDAGSGKTILAMQFLVNGATRFGEPGVFVSFEENVEDLAINMASMGVDLGGLCAENRLAIDAVELEPASIEEAGEYDLEGLFIRIQCALDRVRGRRIVLDSVEALFSGLKEQTTLRSELRRLFGWLKERRLTAIVTGERGEGRLTRHGLEEYVADCVICLDHDVFDQVSTRHVRVVKYRGSVHGANPYPFLIDKQGFSVFPITSIGLDCPVSSEQISTGVPGLDAMCRGGGFYRGSTILVSGGAGTGKSSIAAQFVRAACERGERALYFAFEESREQIIRNMRTIGVDLAPGVARGLLRFHTARPTLCGLETHLANIVSAVVEFAPQVIVLDPVTDFVAVGSRSEVKGMLTRLIDHVKMSQITALFTSLTLAGEAAEQSEAGISSLIDSWVLLRNLEQNGERNRLLYLLKSRGTAHSNQVREFLLTDHGAELLDVCVSAAGVMTGSARREHEARQSEEGRRRKEEIERKQLQLARRRLEVQAEIQVLQRQLQQDEEEVARSIEEVVSGGERNQTEREASADARNAV